VLRLYLRLAVKLMLCVAVLGTLWVLLQATGNRDAAEHKEPLIAIDIADMRPGEVKTLVWANKPLVIVHRLPEWKTLLSSQVTNLLRDPLSHSSVQPDDAMNTFRSVNPDWFVAVGLGTSMGCPLKFIAPSSELYRGVPWPGGFADTCDNSRYDLAGRVFRDQSAKKNIVVPKWQLSNGQILIGR